MKANYEHISLPGALSSISHLHLDVPFFPFHWHYHPEYELTYIQRGNGTRLIGDHVGEYTSGDWVLLGPNLPHCWYSDAELAPEAGEQAIVIQFPHHLVAETLLKLPEFASLRRLMQRSVLGVSFSSSDLRPDVVMNGIAEMRGAERLIGLLGLLERLSEVRSETIASSAYRPHADQVAGGRLAQVFDHIHRRYAMPIRLTDVADLAGMTPTSFSRFFRMMAGQTYIGYVTHLRIHRASEKLIHSRDTIAEIAYQCGFNNLSNFNRIFQDRKSMTPSEFRKRYQRQGRI
jgi:AraC-like DNA-binding protein